MAPSVSINILNTGYLFHAAETSNHGLYLFKSTGDEEENPIICHSQKSLEHENDNINNSIPKFNPRALRNLELRDEI